VKLFKRLRASKFKERYGDSASSYRFVRTKRHWEVLITFSQEAAEVTSDRDNGVIAIDLNADHLALAYVRPDGSLGWSKVVKLPLRGKTQGQRDALLHHVIAKVVRLAKALQAPIVAEELDFAKKKASLGGFGKQAYARMLSSFPYASFRDKLTQHCRNAGLECFFVEPSYTSLLGALLHARAKGLSIHCAAAYVIGRRYLGSGEAIAAGSYHVPDGRGGWLELVVEPVKQSKSGTDEGKLQRKLLKKAIKALETKRNACRKQHLTGSKRRAAAREAKALQAEADWLSDESGACGIQAVAPQNRDGGVVLAA